MRLPRRTMDDILVSIGFSIILRGKLYVFHPISIFKEWTDNLIPFYIIIDRESKLPVMEAVR
jgi:hypothetical protein